MSFNPHQWYLDGLVGSYEPNLFIGGVASTITSASDLAIYLSNYPSGTPFNVSNIKNFTIIGDNIQCYIGVDFEISASKFYNNDNITYFYNTSYLKRVNSTSFGLTSNIVNFVLEDCLTLNGDSILSESPSSSVLKIIDLPKCTSIVGVSHFQSRKDLQVVNIPLVTTLGNTVGYNTIFQNWTGSGKIYCNPFLETNNGGAEDGDIAYARSLGATIVYVDNFTAPLAVDDLAVDTVYATAVKLTFTPPSSTNTIDFYEVYLDGAYYQNISASGDNIIGLNADTTYEITVRAVDIYYNKSEISNKVTQTTSATYVIPTANIVSYWKFENNVLDSVGSNNGTATSITYASGKVGNAAVFNGTSSYISVADDDSLSFGNGSTDSAFSISFLINFNQVSNNPRLIDKVNATNREYRIIQVGNNVFIFLYDNNGSNSITNTITYTPTLNTWYHLTFTYDGSSSNLGLNTYVNGSLVVGTKSSLGTYVAMENLTMPLIIGKDGTGTPNVLDGELDELTFFNKELSAGEVADIYTTLNAGNHLI